MPNSRSTNAEKEKRLIVIQGWIIDDVPTDMIVKQIVARGWVGERQAKRLVASALSKWVEQEDGDITKKRKMKVLQLQQLKRSLQDKYKGTPEGIRAVIAVEKEIIRVSGLAAPVKLEHSGPDGQPLPSTIPQIIIMNPNADQTNAAAI